MFCVVSVRRSLKPQLVGDSVFSRNGCAVFTVRKPIVCLWRHFNQRLTKKQNVESRYQSNGFNPRIICVPSVVMCLTEIFEENKVCILETEIMTWLSLTKKVFSNRCSYQFTVSICDSNVNKNFEFQIFVFELSMNKFYFLESFFYKVLNWNSTNRSNSRFSFSLCINNNSK